MKFGSILLACLVLCFLAVLLLSSLNDGFSLILVMALVLAAAVYAYVQHDDKIEELEKRIKELEEKKED